MLVLLLFFLSQLTSAHIQSYGNSGHGNSPIPVTIEFPSYPSYVPLPANRNFGFVEGNGLILTPSGFISTTPEPADWLITISSVFFGNETLDGPVEFNVFLVLDGNFSDTDFNIVGASNSVSPGQVVQFQGTNIVRNITRGQTLSLVGNNGGSAPFVPSGVIAWAIIATQISESPKEKICCPKSPCQ